MDRTSLYRALSALRRHRWVALSPGPDGRARTAAITPAGAAVLARAEPRWSLLQRRLKERFGGEPWRVLHEELRRLSECARELAEEDDRV